MTGNTKYLSAAYMNTNFGVRIPGISALVNLAVGLLPASWRWKPQRMVASGMVAIGSKVEKRPRRRLSIVVAAYNEAPTLAPVLQPADGEGLG